MHYVIGSLMEGKEYLVITPELDIISFDDLKKAKNRFLHIYHFIRTGIPSDYSYKQSLSLLVALQPTILAIDTTRGELSTEVLKWTTKEASIICPMPIITGRPKLLPMQAGFIKKHEILNIKQDIENHPIVDRSGQITYSQNS